MSEWGKTLADSIGGAVKARRNALGWTAARLSDETARLGYPIHRVAIGKLENGHRGAKFDVAELIILAEALDMPPVQLLFPGLMVAPYEFLPGKTTTAWNALKMFTGELGQSQRPQGLAPQPGREYHLSMMREIDETAHEIIKHREWLQEAKVTGDVEAAEGEERICDGLMKYEALLKDTLKRDGFDTGGEEKANDAEK